MGLGLTETSCCLFVGIYEVVNHEPRPAILWKSILVGVESLGISKAGQTVLARLMESHMWHQFARSVGGGFRKGRMASAPLDARHFSFSLYTTGVFQAGNPVIELRGSESEKVSPCVGSSTDPIPTGFCSHTLWELIFLALAHWAGGFGVGLGLPTPKISLLNIYPPFMDVRPAHSKSVPLLPVWIDMVSLIPQLSDFHST